MMDKTNIVYIDEFAKQLSHKLHANQTRNDRVTPYTVHTDAVAAMCNKYLDAPHHEMTICRAIGHLHDCIEDTNTTAEQLWDYGKNEYLGWGTVVDMVVILSRMSKADNVIDYLNGIKSSPLSFAVKMADLEHNLSDLGPGNLRDKYHLCQAYLKS